MATARREPRPTVVTQVGTTAEELKVCDCVSEGNLNPHPAPSRRVAAPARRTGLRPGYLPGTLGTLASGAALTLREVQGAGPRTASLTAPRARLSHTYPQAAHFTSKSLCL